MSEEHFKVVYDGSALADHSMDVRDLAPALLSLSQAFHRAQDVLDPEAPKVNLSIHAFGAGSFEISMILTEILGVLDSGMEILLGRPVQASITLGTLTSAVWASIKGIKWLGGRRLADARETADGVVELVAEDGATLRIAPAAVGLIRDIEFRRTVSEVIRPLEREGIEQVSVTTTSMSLTIHQEELQAFAPPDIEDEELDLTRREVTLQLLGVEFDNRKWRFTDGTAPITAAIEDKDFLGRIERQEITFGKNDLLRALLRTRQYRDRSDRLKAEHAIERVIRHIDGGRQLPLELGD